VDLVDEIQELGFLTEAEAAELRLLGRRVDREAAASAAAREQDEVAWEAHWLTLERGGRSHPSAEVLARFFVRLSECVAPKMSSAGRAAFEAVPENLRDLVQGAEDAQLADFRRDLEDGTPPT
jgi:hypothetical protein